MTETEKNQDNSEFRRYVAGRVCIMLIICSYIAILTDMCIFVLVRYRDNSDFYIRNTQLSIRKMGSMSAILDFQINMVIFYTRPSNITVACDHDKSTYIEKKLQVENNKIEFVLTNLEPNIRQKCHFYYHNYIINYDVQLPEFTTNLTLAVQIFKFVKPYPKIIGSVTTNEVEGLTRWVEYGTPTTPYQLHTSKQPIIFDQSSNNTRSIISQL